MKTINFENLKTENLELSRLEEIKNRLAEIEKEHNEIFENLDKKGGFDKVWNENKEKVNSLDNEKDYLTYLQTRINKFNVKVGDGVTLNYYSDNHAYTIIKRTKSTITIQRDKATLSKDFKPDFIAGGFATHCNNQNEQSYTYERDLKGNIEVARWSNKKGCYIVNKCLKVSNGRHEFYDYNF